MASRDEIFIKKKSGTLEDYDSDKIVAAIRKSAERTDEPLTDQEEGEIVALIENRLCMLSDNVVPVEKMHNMVILALVNV